MAGSAPAADDEQLHEHHSQELFQIIDETGEGFGFDLTPQALARPLLIGTGALFSVGMLAGIPIGLAMGRAGESGKKLPASRQPRPTLDGIKFAASAFGLGTLLCAAGGTAAFFAVKRFYAVDSFEQFGQVMREVVPLRRNEIENGLAPVLNSVRQTAGDSLPEPMRRIQLRVANSWIGRWVSSHISDVASLPSSDKSESKLPDHHDAASKTPPS